jgi:hypothetical protein
VSIAPRHAWAIDAHIVGQLAHPAFALFLVVIVIYDIVAACAFKHGKVVNGYAMAWGPATSANFIVVVFWKFLLFATGCDIVAPDGGRPRPSRLSQVEPPVPAHNEGDVEEIKGYHGDRLPQMQFPVNDEAHAEGRCNEKETNIANKTLARDLKGAN